jgi:hypothetical protein
LEDVPLSRSEESADTYHDHMHRGHDKSEDGPKRLQHAFPEGEYCIQIMHHVLFAFGRGILEPFRDILRFLLASVYKVMVRLHSLQGPFFQGRLSATKFGTAWWAAFKPRVGTTGLNIWRSSDAVSTVGPLVRPHCRN